LNFLIYNSANIYMKDINALKILEFDHKKLSKYILYLRKSRTKI